MQFHVRTFVEFFVLSGYLLAAFAVIGAPVKLALHAFGITAARAASAPIIGLAIAVLGSWYWATPGGGTKPLYRILLAVGLLAIGAWVVWMLATKRSLMELPRTPHIRQSAALFLICFAGIGVATVANQAQLFTQERFTVLSLGNNDAPSYALLGQHMLDDGPEEFGTVAGFDAGHRSLGFSNGAYSALAASASVSDQDVWRVMQPTLFLTLVLGAYATALLLREIFQRTHIAALGVAAVCGFAVVYSTYLVGHWFYAQFIGIALVTSITALVFRTVRATQWSGRLSGVAVIALLLGAGLSVYPHMVVMGSIALLPVSAIAIESWRAFFRRIIVTGLTFTGAGALAAAIAPGLVSDAIEITRELEGVEAGWPLPAVFPVEMLGFQTSVDTTQSWITVAISGLLILGLVALAVVAWRRGLGSRAAPLLTAAAVAIVTYTVVYHREGGSTYRQWKWVTFFIPLFVAVCLALVVLVAFSATKRADVSRQIGWGVLAGYFVVTGLVFASAVGFPLRSSGFLSVAPDQIDLEVNPHLDDIDELHINVAPYWETMWLAYFLRDHDLTLATESYYPPAAPVGRFYIERNDVPVAPGADAIPLNNTYRLVRMP